MAPKGGLGRGLSDIKADQSDSNYNALISGLTFASLTTQHGGATMDANTGDFLDTSDPSKDTFVVGKEPDTKGMPIKTSPLSASQDAAGHLGRLRRQILSQTGRRPGVAIGSWKTDSGIDIDASGLEPDLNKALEKATDRDEQAIFSTKKFRETGDGDIANPNYKGE